MFKAVIIFLSLAFVGCVPPGLITPQDTLACEWNKTYHICLCKQYYDRSLALTYVPDKICNRIKKKD